MAVLKLLSRFFFQEIFINVERGKGGGGGGADGPTVKSSAVKCPNTCDQDCKKLVSRLTIM